MGAEQARTFVPFRPSVKEKHSFTPLSAAVESKSKHSFYHGPRRQPAKNRTFLPHSIPAARTTRPDSRPGTGPNIFTAQRRTSGGTGPQQDKRSFFLSATAPGANQNIRFHALRHRTERNHKHLCPSATALRRNIRLPLYLRQWRATRNIRFTTAHAVRQQREQTFPTCSAAAHTPPDPRQRAGPAGRG